MAQHEKFSCKSGENLKSLAASLGVKLPYQEDISPLGKSLELGKWKVPNRMVIQPMEGCDGDDMGRPSELTMRRYERFARGGSGLLWMEATAVHPDGRANPRQLQIREESLEALTEMVHRTRVAAKEAGQENPILIVQLTHSGRYSKPDGTARPITATENVFLDAKLTGERHIITDDELDALQENYITAAKLAIQAGFDGVDIKSCHGYLLGELLSGYNRPGKYGGSLENRTRMIREVTKKVYQAVEGKVFIASRLNVYDGLPAPSGWGSDSDGKPDWTEPQWLIKELYERGMILIDATCGNPYYNPHINRPYDRGYYTPPVHPLENLTVLLEAARQVKQAEPKMSVICSGLTWLRRFGGNVGAAGVAEGSYDLAGFGRQALAYPNYAKDLLAGNWQANQECLTCSSCTVMMRDGGVSGCPIRDGEVYRPLFQKGREGKEAIDGSAVAYHV